MHSSVVERRPVTVVIPIFGDLQSLEVCVISVLENVDLSLDKLLLVNDCGPDADLIESRVLELISGVENVSYHRNVANLGFVATCNRAALVLDDSGNDILLLNSDARLTAGALDEMRDVLAAHEKHGIVFPRSNNASIASVPLLPLNEMFEREADSYSVYEKIRENLPRYAITPIAVGFCFLIRRQLIENYGLFDEAYSPGYSEENDFCLRVNKYGYSSVVANQAFVFHEGTKSFDDRAREELKARNERLMVSRYPFYHASVAHYLQFAVDPVDWFADRIVGNGTRRVMIDLFHMSLVYNGSTRNALSFLELLSTRRGELDVEFVVVSSAEAIEFFDLSSYGFRVVANGSLAETFDLGFALAPVSAPTQIYLLNRHCVRWVVSHFDVIALRVHSLLEVSYLRREVVLDSLRYADRVIPISEAALEDIEAFFGEAASGIRDRSTVIHEGVAETRLRALPTPEVLKGLSARDEGVLEAGGYVLVIGNSFTHKQFPEALDALRGISTPVVAFGAFLDPELRTEHYTFIEGGWLSDDQVDTLYRKAACVVFPSSYEGFGLPIAEATKRSRPLVTFDTSVAREVVESLGVEDLVTFFDRFEDLPESIARAVAAGVEAPDRHLRPLKAYNEAILDVLLLELAKPVDIPALKKRTAHLRSAEMYSDVVEHRLRMIEASTAVRLARMAERRLGPLRPIAKLALRGIRFVRRRGGPREITAS